MLSSLAPSQYWRAPYISTLMSIDILFASEYSSLFMNVLYAVNKKYLRK